MLIIRLVTTLNINLNQYSDWEKIEINAMRIILQIIRLKNKIIILLFSIWIEGSVLEKDSLEQEYI